MKAFIMIFLSIVLCSCSLGERSLSTSQNVGGTSSDAPVSSDPIPDQKVIEKDLPNEYTKEKHESSVLRPSGASAIPEKYTGEWIASFSHSNQFKKNKAPLCAKINILENGTGDLVTSYPTSGINGIPKGCGYTKIRVCDVQSDYIIICWDEWEYTSDDSLLEVFPENKITLYLATYSSYELDEKKFGLADYDDVITANGPYVEDFLVGYAFNSNGEQIMKEMFLDLGLKKKPQDTLRIIEEFWRVPNGDVIRDTAFGDTAEETFKYVLFYDDLGREHMRCFTGINSLLAYEDGKYSIIDHAVVLNDTHPIEQVIFVDAEEILLLGYQNYYNSVTWINLFQLDNNTGIFTNVSAQHPNVYAETYKYTNNIPTNWKDDFQGAKLVFNNLMLFAYDGIASGTLTNTKKGDVIRYVIENYAGEICDMK